MLYWFLTKTCNFLHILSLKLCMTMSMCLFISFSHHSPHTPSLSHSHQTNQLLSSSQSFPAFSFNSIFQSIWVHSNFMFSR
ncbi:hypothetical protein QVD17_01541 [Tagetes erecta]|uniref:Uncharacterized protein n=1 Tax=Tagetes erecta TaxID=13708 RepID=A0AAD8L6J7_TARER|nr:hypothetical protein QVD17_01541 [Tagetes erecta]